MKRLSYEFVKEQFENEGWVLLTVEYKNCEQKLDCVCSKGHRHSISWHNWNSGWRCPICHHEKIANKKRMGIDFIRSEFEKEGYELLSKEYVDAHTKLKYRCPKGHEHNIIWNSWQRGHRCLYCAGNAKLTIEFIRAEFKKEGYVLLTKKYIDNKQKLEYICPKGHEHIISWGDWQQGKRCQECHYLSKFGSGNPSWKGGISCEPYCDAWADKEYKESILERDNNKCQNPDCWGTMPGDLTIHHIDYVKKHCDPWNLITLCRSCNSRANRDREWHKDFYRIIIKKKYNFKEV